MICLRSIYDFFVTLTQEPLWQTVPRLVLCNNFLICGWILEPDTLKCSACQMLHLRRIIRMLSLILELKKPKKLKVLVWQAKFESGIIFFGNWICREFIDFVNSDYIPSQKPQKTRQNYITLVWHTPLVMVPIWGVLPPKLSIKSHPTCDSLSLHTIQILQRFSVPFSGQMSINRLEKQIQNRFQ